MKTANDEAMKTPLKRGPRRDALLSAHEVAPHVRQQYIEVGYRQPLSVSSSLTIATLRGLLTWHTETANVWTHLLGLCWALSRLVDVQARAAGVEPAARLSVGAFHLSAILVLLASSLAHLYAPILPAKPAMRFWRLDHASICVAIGGGYVPGLMYGFRCHPLARASYATLASAAG